MCYFYLLKYTCIKCGKSQATTRDHVYFHQCPVGLWLSDHGRYESCRDGDLLNGRIVVKDAAGRMLPTRYPRKRIAAMEAVRRDLPKCVKDRVQTEVVPWIVYALKPRIHGFWVCTNCSYTQRTPDEVYELARSRTSFY